MKKTVLLTICLGILLGNLSAQKNDDMKQNYRRSSLHIVLMESSVFPNKDTIMEAYLSAPFPEKYNQHSIDNNSFNIRDYLLTQEEKTAVDSSSSKLSGAIRKASDQVTGSIIDSLFKFYPAIIDKYLSKTKMANQLVAKWFNRNEKGEFNMDLISKRGFYDASAINAEIASKTARGSAILGDAGEELIKNTFVVINKMNFVSNEAIATLIKNAAILIADETIETELGRKAAYKAADIVYNKTKDGYSVWTTSYLYQLEWNDSIAAIFYDDYWVDANTPNPEKVAAFDNANLFQLNYIGQKKATSLVAFSGEGKSTEKEILTLATIRNLDKVYAKLQKEYDVFQTKTPIASVDPITAKIGMKEGLEGGEKFQIFEQVTDKKTGLTKYVKKGIISVDKKKIWDNRYNLDGVQDTDENGLSGTVFKGGGKNIYPGMLIKQIK